MNQASILARLSLEKLGKTYTTFFEGDSEFLLRNRHDYEEKALTQKNMTNK